MDSTPENDLKAQEHLEADLLDVIAKLSPKVKGIYLEKYLELIKKCRGLKVEREEKPKT